MDLTPEGMKSFLLKITPPSREIGFLTTFNNLQDLTANQKIDFILSIAAEVRNESTFTNLLYCLDFIITVLESIQCSIDSI